MTELSLCSTDPDDILWNAYTASDWMEAREGKPLAGRITILPRDERKYYLGLVATQLDTAHALFEAEMNFPDNHENLMVCDSVIGAVEELWHELNVIELAQLTRTS